MHHIKSCFLVELIKRHGRESHDVRHDERCDTSRTDYIDTVRRELKFRM